VKDINKEVKRNGWIKDKKGNYLFGNFGF
jgi:hypothetical protein